MTALVESVTVPEMALELACPYKDGPARNNRIRRAANGSTALRKYCVTGLASKAKVRRQILLCLYPNEMKRHRLIC
jgi:hypothetical protein